MSGVIMRVWSTSTYNNAKSQLEGYQKALDTIKSDVANEVYVRELETLQHLIDLVVEANK